jgi:pimeloyl-ACP methyl ester carboxylesterase
MKITLIDDVSIRVQGREIPLVSSRKTLALLAYLLITGREQRRETLCDLLFSGTNDPRASLRWSLTKLRKMLNCEAEVLLATSNSVRIDMEQVDLDVNFVHSVHDDPGARLADLEQAATLLSCSPFIGLEISQATDYTLWLMGEREQLKSLRGGIFRRMSEAPCVSDQEAVRWLRTWARLDPYSHDAPKFLSCKLSALGLMDEAHGVTDSYLHLMGEQAQPMAAPEPAEPKSLDRQAIGFCKAADGVSIAYASVGSGPPIVKAANWLNHLELDWASPIWGDTFRELAAQNTLIRYDERGNGLSDWDVPEISFRSFVEDLETVVEHLGLDRFPLLGLSQGCAVSIEYTVKHPEKVSALILIGGYAAGWRIDLPKAEQEQREAVLTLTRHGWGTANPAYRHIFSQTFMPDADQERLAWFDEFQRQCTSAENAVRFQEAFGHIDVRHLLPLVKVPTLVLHARDDLRIPLDCGRELATEIPDAKLVTLESKSHIILGDEPAWQTCMDEIRRFLAEHGVA